MPVVLDPDAAFVMQAFRDAGRPAYETLTPKEAREFYLAGRVVSNPEPPEMANVENRTIPGPAQPIPVRIYTPKQLRKTIAFSSEVGTGSREENASKQKAGSPALVFFHGGGWVIGDLDSHDVVCRTLARDGEMIVISVDYRLAPEHKHPAAVDDALAATRWVAGNATSLGIDATKISVGGDSAGGNLAAITAIDARANGPKIQGQLLIYPATDFAMTHPSHSEPETSCLLTHSVIRWFRDHYLPSIAAGEHWKASPARIADMKGLPPAYVLTAGADPLRDEGDEYAKRLEAAGVPVTWKTYPGQFHGFITMGKLLTKANGAIKEMGDWLKSL